MRLFALLLLCLSVLTVGCQRDNHPRLPDDEPDTVLPSAGPSAISTTGGHAQGLTGRSSGDSGSIGISIQGGRPLLDDGRARATAGPNFFDISLQTDNVVTYTELATAQAPVIAGGVATFDLAVEGVFLFGGVRLDLGDAPSTGPTVNTVEIIAAGPIRIDGSVRTTRADADAVGLRLISTHNLGVSVDGGISAAAVNGFDGGSVYIEATNGPVIANGRIRADGGPATAALDGGDGGNVTLIAGDGDMILRGGAWSASALEGRLSGGNAGDVVLIATGTAQVDFRWSMAANGGRGVDGDGGAAGGIVVSLDGSVTWFTRIDAAGGASANGTAGDAGSATLLALQHSGFVRMHGDGGAATNGAAGDGAALQISGAHMRHLNAAVYTRGGNGDSGGDGGNISVDNSALLEDCDFQVWAHGGSGTTQGGNGGSAYLNATGAGALRNFNLKADARGGGSQNVGGQGGSGGVSSAGPAQVSNAEIELLAGGGSGAQGGAGGTAEVFLNGGGAWGTFVGEVRGGAGTTGAGGGGGNIALYSVSGSVDFVVSVNAGGGSGNTGGAGGTIDIGSDPATTGGTTRVLGEAVAGGGVGDSAGGAGGQVVIQAGDGGIALEGMDIEVPGGAGDTGGAGGTISLVTTGSIGVTGGVLVANGGAGVATGGVGGTVSFTTSAGAVTLNASCHAQGGGGTAGGMGGAIAVSTDDDGTGDAGGFIHTHGGILNVQGAQGAAGGTIMVNATATDAGGADGAITIGGAILARGGSNGAGGAVSLVTEGVLNITGIIDVTGGADGDGGTIDVLDAQLAALGGTARLIADGRNAGLAGTITVDPAGAGPNNPALVIHAGATVRTNDGDGTDQSATNITLD
jgi:hypothetical protein